MTNDLIIHHKGYLFTVSGDYLHISKGGITMGELCVAPVIEGKMPRVYFLTGLAGAYDALELHRDLSMALGWMIRRDAVQPAWWARPTFKPAMDLFAGEHGLRVLYKNEQTEIRYSICRCWPDFFDLAFHGIDARMWIAEGWVDLLMLSVWSGPAGRRGKPVDISPWVNMAQDSSTRVIQITINCFHFRGMAF